VNEAVEVLSISLISHTNVGKTTLARTLLRRDVGEVLDQAHVTEESELFVLLEVAPQRDGGPAGRIVLWDNPGFGDSIRLVEQIAGQADPLDWLAEQRFERPEERPLRSSQRAVANVREHADVVLYLVNASEDPATAGYVEPEMRILGWLGRPVIALLNQTGSPVGSEARRRAEERWRWHLASHAAVRDVVSLDAFTRCWVQEGLLLLRLQALVSEDRTAWMGLLLERWREERMAALAGSVEVLADLLWDAARDAEPVPPGWLQPLERRRAARALAERLTGAARRSNDALITLHGLEGGGASWVRGQLEDVALPGQRPDPLRSGMVGGAVGGAVGGLAADLASGGLSLGGGMLAGALLGGLGLGGLAWAFEQVAGASAPRVVWSGEYLTRLAHQSLLRYLALAHFGRGTGAFRERLEPEFWRPVVERACDDRAFARVWKRARGGGPEARAQLTALLDAAMRGCLTDLYPGAERFLGPGRPD
jgi:hypothetical protein